MMVGALLRHAHRVKGREREGGGGEKKKKKRKGGKRRRKVEVGGAWRLSHQSSLRVEDFPPRPTSFPRAAPIPGEMGGKKKKSEARRNPSSIIITCLWHPKYRDVAVHIRAHGVRALVAHSSSRDGGRKQGGKRRERKRRTKPATAHGTFITTSPVLDQTVPEGM